MPSVPLSQVAGVSHLVAAADQPGLAPNASLAHVCLMDQGFPGRVDGIIWIRPPKEADMAERASAWHQGLPRQGPPDISNNRSGISSVVP